MTIKAILFDHDGTLVDSEPTHFQMWISILGKYGVSLSEQQYKRYYAGVPTVANSIDMARRFNLSIDAAQLASDKNLATRNYLAKNSFPLMPGVRDSIDFFRARGKQLGIVTGAGSNGANSTINGHDLQDCFSTVVSGDDVENSKPAPDCYLLAIERLGVTPNETIAIEDTEHGVAAATAADIICLAVPTSLSENHDFSSASGVFENINAATNWIDGKLTL